MPKNVTFVEINVYDGMIPLATGYLEAYARQDPELRRDHRFTKYVTTRTTPIDTIVRDLVRTEADVFALSSYIWNMGLVKALVPRLLEARPRARILLGGPQVMHHAHDYVEPHQERVAVCNGEGEQVFSNYLRALTDARPDLTGVSGLSFFRDGEMIHTEAQPRIQDLDGIPSPFLNDLFDDSAAMSILETNRGCPFHCAFCYWGAANNDRVYKFSEDRVREEIAWISRAGIPTLLIADANWGMLKRDVHLSRHIAECRAENFTPMVVHFSAAKNSPARVAEITKIFQDAGLFSPQPISMQSLDENALEQIRRTNIKLDAFESLQDNLNERGTGSYIELIWPLPGETLASFRKGISTLCARRAHTIVIYTHLLLHNTPLFRRREELGLVTRPAHDGLAEADIVVQTADVSAEDFVDGMWLIYATKSLYNTRVLRILSRYLHRKGVRDHGDLYADFVDFCRTEPDHPYSRFCRESVAEARYYDITNYPAAYFLVLHGERAAFEALLHRFASAQSWWNDPDARALFEVDALKKPFLYRDAAIAGPAHPLREVTLLEASDHAYLVEIPQRVVDLLATLSDEPAFAAARGEGVSAPRRFRVDHRRRQHRYSADQSAEAQADYCSGAIARIETIMPAWTLAPQESTSASRRA